MPLPRRLPLGNQATTSVPKGCFHCDRGGPANELCQLWRAWICKDCCMLYHRPHHPTCDIPPKIVRRDRDQRLSTYTVCLTRFDGQRLYMVCRIGQKLRLQDHPEGTYIFASSGVTLVLEKRATINKRVVQGLAELARPADDS